MTLNSEAKYSSGGGGEPRGSSIESFADAAALYWCAFYEKQKLYTKTSLSSVNATKTKDQKGVHATREIDDDGDSNARAVRENCVLLCISKYI